MSLRDLQRRHAAQIARSAFGPGETIEFATSASATPVEVRAVLQKLGLIADGETDTVIDRTRVAIPNQALSGVGVSAVPKSARLRFARQEGEDPIWWRVVDVVSSDAAWWVLDVEAVE